MVQQFEHSTGLAEANKLIVLSGGARYDLESGHASLNPASIERADAVGQYFREDSLRFTAHDAVIVCAGGYEAKSGQIKPPRHLSEGMLTCDYLMDEWNIPANKLEAETESVSTLSNIANTLGLAPGSTEIINPREIGPDNPLGLVSHQDHLIRAVLLASKLGINPDYLDTDVCVSYDHDPVHEVLSRVLYLGGLVGTHTPEQVFRREKYLINPAIRIVMMLAQAGKLAIPSSKQSEEQVA